MTREEKLDIICKHLEKKHFLFAHKESCYYDRIGDIIFGFYKKVRWKNIKP